LVEAFTPKLDFEGMLLSMVSESKQLKSHIDAGGLATLRGSVDDLLQTELVPVCKNEENQN
jgi:hypothetical protein